VLRPHSQCDVAPVEITGEVGWQRLLNPGPRKRAPEEDASTTPSMKFIVGVPKKPATKRVAGRF
jgi:hypothetical protein